ncbi:acyltransferase [Noviherbaspirillum sp. 1P10PC]|uniref:acyltransferase family protein n=1 Tax=Noviherbaspirillum sp. 1P10PC TaxID=3132292 RepID=UPI0039A257A6
MDPEIKQPRFEVTTVFECVRGLSALWVFLFHIADSLQHLSPFLFAIARYGYQGVPIFFVISGYCIYASAEETIRKGQHPNNFLLRRLIRVMPPFWASILLIAALPYFVEAISSLKSGVYHVPSPKWLQFGAIDWLKIATLTQVFFNKNGNLQDAFSPINAVYWSLSIEIQLYIVIYLTSFFKSRRKKILMLVLAASIFATAIPTLRDSGLFFSFWPAFFLGILLRWAHEKGVTPNMLFGKMALIVSFAGTAFLSFLSLFFIFFPNHFGHTLTINKYNLTFTFAAIIATGFLWMLGEIEYRLSTSKSLESNDSKFRIALLVPTCLLGQSSYSLYLLHGQLQQLPAMFIRQIISPDTILFPFFTISATVLLCFLFYKFVEIPFLKLGKIISKRNSTLLIASPTAKVI